MSDLVSGLNRVFRYGLAPKGDMVTLARQAMEGDTFNPNNVADGVFADFLEDHDDPRSEIVRRDIGYRSKGGTIYDGQNEHRDSLIGRVKSEHKLHDGTPLPDGSIVSVWKNTGTDGRHAYGVSWGIPLDTYLRSYYYAHFSPDEYRQLADRLGVKLAE